ncbi:MAG: CoA-binding protein [Candidatus Helarchaeota archaeon]|nr:CoA-binding protein [Candidatus Helarchaeota archaeon]
MSAEFLNLFYPKGIAVIGASTNLASGGSPFVISLMTAKFPNIYPINPHHQEIFGLKAYPSVSAVPDPVDYVIIAIPKAKVAGALEDCIQKGGVKVVCCFAGGYSELGEAGFEEEEKLVERARANNIRLLGPNCIGLYCAESRISFQIALHNTVGPENAGNISIISQSGGNTDVSIGYGHSLGMRFRFAVSYGNGSDINSDELLEVFSQDSQTHLILEYLEGFRTPEQARHFLTTLKKTCKIKPVVLWLGGVSESGARAIKSHTGSIAGNTKVSSTALQQNGALQVNNIYDFLHTGLLISLLRESGKLSRVTPDLAVVGGGGGNSIQYADVLSALNLRLPPFDEAVQAKLRETAGEIGTLLKNPIDLNTAMFNINIVKKIIKIIDDNLNCVLVFEPGIEWFIFMENFMKENMHEASSSFTGILKQNVDAMIRFERTLKNPLVVMSPSWFHDPAIIRFKQDYEQRFLKHNIPVFSQLSYMGVAIANAVKYNKWLENNKD